jgi:D-serine deaminase-like pyridoxal phosphate-dependent protein
MEMLQWFELENADELDSPALVVYKDRVTENIRSLVKRVKDVSRIRPHVKTHKMAEVCSLMLAEGITKFKCATIAEAEMLASAGAPDVLLAFQPVGPKVSRFLQIVRNFPAVRFSCLTDSIPSAKALSASAAENALQLNVFIDLNVGMNRTGILPADAMPLIDAVKKLPALSFAGLHAYDGHIADANVEVRKQRGSDAFRSVEQLASSVESKYGIKPVIVAGGSPTYAIYANRGGVECSPGTFVFWDRSYQKMMPEEPYRPAALVICRVVSIVDKTRLCLDLGHKSLSADHPQPRVYFLNAPDAVPLSHSEEHLVVTVRDTAAHHIGEIFYGIPQHVCPTVALYERAAVAEENSITGEWEVTARNKKLKW